MPGLKSAPDLPPLDRQHSLPDMVSAVVHQQADDLGTGEYAPALRLDGLFQFGIRQGADVGRPGSIGFFSQSFDVSRITGLAFVLGAAHGHEAAALGQGLADGRMQDAVHSLADVLEQEARAGALRRQALVAVLVGKLGNGAEGHVLILLPEGEEGRVRHDSDMMLVR